MLILEMVAEEVEQMVAQLTTSLKRVDECRETARTRADELLDTQLQELAKETNEGMLKIIGEFGL